MVSRSTTVAGNGDRALVAPTRHRYPGPGWLGRQLQPLASHADLLVSLCQSSNRIPCSKPPVHSAMSSIIDPLSNSIVGSVSPVSPQTHLPTSEVLGLGPPSGPRSSGHLGFTSHSTVFKETIDSLYHIRGSQGWLPRLKEGSFIPSSTDSDGVLTSPTREECLLVLRNIPSASYDLRRPFAIFTGAR